MNDPGHSISLLAVSILLHVLCAAATANAQAPDTVWFDRQWKHTENVETRHYYRTWRRADDTLFEIFDHFPDGTIQMHAFSTTVEPTTMFGTCTYYHENGTPESEGAYVRGLRTGLWKRWHSDGRLADSGHYVEDRYDGVWVGWYDNGVQSYRSEYDTGKGTGTWKWWHSNRQLKERGSYVDGKREGEWAGWYESGTKRFRTRYSMDSLDGEFREWYGDGTLHKLDTYALGLWNGTSTEWYPNGQKESEGEYRNGEREKLWRWWYENGKLRAREEYAAGKAEGLSTTWYENGAKRSEGAYLHSEWNGLWQTWYRNGRVWHADSFATGRHVGTSLEWMADGSLSGRCIYTADSTQEPEWTFYFPNGNVSARIVYRNDTEIVRARYWNEDGSEQTDSARAERPAACTIGDSAMHAFLRRRIRYPDRALRDGTEGTVAVYAHVLEDGTIGETGIAKSLSTDLDEEARRVVSLLPRFNPAREHNRITDSWVTIPVDFVLDE